MPTTLVSGGTVVSSTGRHTADVLIDGEKIVAVLDPGSTVLGSDLKRTVDTVVDATGKYVFPGGIDAHTHMEMPFGGTVASDSFETGTRAAAWGGTTTIIDFSVQTVGQQLMDCLGNWHDKARGECAIDYAFPAWAEEYMAAMEDALGEAYSEPVADVRGYIEYVRSQAV